MWNWKVQLGLAVVVVAFAVACGDGPVDGGGEDATGGDVILTDGTAGDGGPACEVKVDGACACQYDGSGQGVCADQRLNAQGECAEPKAYASTEAVCTDGLDNDCDGDVDCADSDCAAKTCGLGQGTAECISGRCQETVCSDGSDNDEDGEADCRDPDCTGETCAEGETWSCPSPDDWEDDEGSCDDIDNDCDGATDEGCPCTYDPDEDDDIDTDGSNDAGVCTGETQTMEGTCPKPEKYGDNQVENAAGFCDRLDNNCDGVTDDQCPCTYDPGESDNADTDNSHGYGVCPGQRRDSSGTCPEPGDYDGTDDEISASLCDDKDNDCDRAVDEGCSCTYDPTENDNVDTDNSHDEQVCRGQTRDGSGMCTQPGDWEDPEQTLCNDGKDNDCDGKTDESTDSLGPGDSCSNGCECGTGPCIGGTCPYKIQVKSLNNSGNLGGLSGADSQCGGANWKAILSDSNTSAKSRLTINGPVVDGNGTKIADDANDLWDGSLDNPIDSSGERVWTGTDGSGASASANCQDWTDGTVNNNGLTGWTNSTTGSWLSSRNAFCNNIHGVYCINGQ